jgi:5-guanidino-2-oxopentanoate decarboxylase
MPAKLVAGAADLEKAADWLASARNPAVIVGGGAALAAGAVRTIAERLSAPVATTVAGIGIFPGTHPLSLGPTLVGMATREILNSADVVLAAGTELASTDTWGGVLDFSGRAIRVDVDPRQFEQPHRADLAIRADARDALEAIAAALPEAETGGRLQASERRVADAVSAWRDSMAGSYLQCRHVFEVIVAAVPTDTVFTADMTQIAYSAHTVFRPQEPGRFFYPQGYGTLGYALPAALGVKLAAPRRPVVALVGDGGILYTLTEMATAIDEDIPIVVALWNNNSLQQIREGFEERGIKPIAVSPRAPDFQVIARGFGWETTKVAALADVGAAIAAALEARRPTLVEIDANALGI